MRLSQRGVTLIELLFVCGIFLVVLTMLALSLRQTVASQKQLDRGSEVLVQMELARLKVTDLLRRSELGGPMDFGATTNSLQLRLFQMQTPSQPLLDAQGQPVQGAVATLAMEAEGQLVVRGGPTPTLLSRLGEGATFQATRLSESRFLFRLTAEDGQLEPREMVFSTGF